MTKGGKDFSSLLLIFYTVLTQKKFELKSVTQLNSAQCHRLYYLKNCLKIQIFIVWELNKI